jgi:hypothetical protein
MTIPAETIAAIRNESDRHPSATYGILARTLGVNYSTVVKALKGRPVSLARRGRPSLLTNKPDVVMGMRRARFLYPTMTDAQIATMQGVCVATFRKYADNIPSPRRHVVRTVNMRTAACYAVSSKIVKKSVEVSVKETTPTLTILFDYILNK